tara:strand:+ start:10476 stop:11447 length:972 start_codon:yes stop_codon:yes gene_type:complete
MASFHRPKVLEKALQKIDEIAPDSLDHIHLLLHSSDVHSKSLVESLNLSHKISIHIAETKTSPGRSRNILLSHATTQWVCFLDDDVIVNQDYFLKANQILREENCQGFGGPDQALQGDTLQETMGKLLESSIIMGNTYCRHSLKADVSRVADELMLTLCNFWVDRYWLEKFQIKFSEELLRCEENLLVDQMKRGGAVLCFFPQLYVFHLRRTRLEEIFKIQLKSGFFRGVHLSHPESYFKSIFLIPLLTGFGLAFLPLLAPSLFFLLAKFHFVLNLWINLNIFLKLKSIKGLIFGMATVVLIHTGFSLGLMLGMIKGKLGVTR